MKPHALRLIRRLEAAKKKRAAFTFLSKQHRSDPITPALVGKYAAVHCAKCSCLLCCNPRRVQHKHYRTPQELRAMDELRQAD